MVPALPLHVGVGERANACRTAYAVHGSWTDTSPRTAASSSVNGIVFTGRDGTAWRPPMSLDPNRTNSRMSIVRSSVAVVCLLAAPVGGAGPSAAQDRPPWVPGPPLTIARAPGSISGDGDLGDAGWKDVTPITSWYETRVGDNVEPQVKNTGYLTYDDHYFYEGVFVFRKLKKEYAAVALRARPPRQH